MEPSVASAGWYRDPAGRYRLRYWDGSTWTDHVATGDAQTHDPLAETPLPPPPPVDPTPPAPTPTTAVSAAPPPPEPALGPPTVGPPPPPPSRRPSTRTLFAIGAAVILVAGVIIAVLTLRGGNSTSSSGSLQTTSSSPTRAPATGPLRVPQSIADFQLRRDPSTSNLEPNLILGGGATYTRGSGQTFAVFTLSVLTLDPAFVERAIPRAVDEAQRGLKSTTPPATVTSAGTQYTCITGNLGPSAPAVRCLWRVGKLFFSILAVNLDQQAVLSLAPQAQAATAP